MCSLQKRAPRAKCLPCKLLLDIDRGEEGVFSSFFLIDKLILLYSCMMKMNGRMYTFVDASYVSTLPSLKSNEIFLFYLDLMDR